MEVKADNYQVFGSLNFETNEVKVNGLMKSFEFELGALDQAFNSDRLDLSGYPKFKYEGLIETPENIDLNKAGTYTADVKGDLFIGEHKRVTSAVASFTVDANGSMEVVVDFSFQIEEESLEIVNQLMKERLPSLISLDVNKLGISRDVVVHLSMSLK